MATKEFLFDVEKFMIGNEHSNYSLEYELFRSDVDTSEMSEKEVQKICEKIERKTNQACFSNFRNAYDSYFKRAKVKANRIRFFCEPKKHIKAATHLSKDKIEEWVKLCQTNNLMPKNIGKNYIENGIYDICFEDISMEMCYVYLCAGRYVQEEPYFVKGILYLMESHKLGFFTAFCLASYYQATNSGHHILPICRDYWTSQMPKHINEPIVGGFGNSFEMIHASKLANFVHGGDKGKPIKDLGVSLPHIELHQEMTRCWDKKKPINFNVDRKNLKDKRLESILKLGNLDKKSSTTSKMTI
jgi:hypothetical protein